MNAKRFGRFGKLGLVMCVALISVGCAAKRGDMMTGRGLVELDEAWAVAARDGDVDEIMDFWTESAVLYAPNLPALYGKQAIRDLIEKRRTDPAHRITWTPSCAGIEPGGSMAYTLGEGTVTLADDAGVPREQFGRYVAVWRREPDRWRCAVKCWTPSVPGAGSN